MTTTLHQERSEDVMQRAILGAVKARMAEIAEEELAGITERVNKRVCAELDRLALSVLKQYEITTGGAVTTIRVFKP